MDGDGFSRLQRLLPCLILFFFLTSCSDNKKKPVQVTKSYYFWRDGSSINRYEADFLKEHAIHKLYVKLLDIDWTDVNGAHPVDETMLEYVANELNYYYKTPHVDLVPVIFITNNTFNHIDYPLIPQLAERIIRRCLPSWDSLDIRWEARKKEDYPFRTLPDKGLYNPTEIQFDCDWTIATAPKYFYFLNTVNSMLRQRNILLSATIRLHQFKYTEKTGVPPVDRGMLMVYNISDLTKYNTLNSIFDPAEAKLYFTGKNKYPIPMDIALPAYSWSVIFRNKEFYQLENHLGENELKQQSFLKSTGNNIYQVTQDTVYRNLYLRPGDEIRAETINKDLLQEAAKLAGKAVNTDSFSVALFELSETEIKNYDHQTIEAVYNSYN